MKNKLILTLVACFLTHIALATDCSDLKQRWYGQYIRDFHVKWSTRTFDCPEGESNLAQAFYDLENSQFTPDVNGYIPNFYKIAKRHVKGFYYDPKCSALAYSFKETGIIYTCPGFDDDSREDRASTIVHESRHLEADDPAHVKCVGGAYNGNEGACDKKFYGGDRKGSGFNADVNFYSWMISDSDLNELSASVMQSELNAIIPDRFNIITNEEMNEWRK